MQVFVLADDLTGALEVGAKFAGAGLAALVTTDRRVTHGAVDEAFRVLVVDTETRHASASEAHRLVYDQARSASQARVRYIFKKTDSTLRGNIASELAALTEACPGEPIIYAPAYPRMGRTVQDGILLVNGVPVSQTLFSGDKLNPIRESHIPTLIGGAGFLSPIRSIRAQALHDSLPPAIYVVDGAEEEDIRFTAQAFVSSQDYRLAAGPAGFAHYLAEFLSPPGSLPPELPCLKSCIVINGSRHDASLAQVRHAKAEGWPESAPTPAGGAATGGSWTIMEDSPEEEEEESVFAARLGRRVRDTLRANEVDAIVVFGGDTANGILSALACSRIQPIGEVITGVPVSRIESGAGNEGLGKRYHDLYLITKAGGFGTPDLLAQLRARLSTR